MVLKLGLIHPWGPPHKGGQKLKKFVTPALIIQILSYLVEKYFAIIHWMELKLDPIRLWGPPRKGAENLKKS